MKQKAKIESKIPTTQKNTNQKKKAKKTDGLDLDGSLLKKNEFTMIIAGALVVTVLVFFFFFRSSGSDSVTGNTGGDKGNLVGMDGQGLEKRISALEVSLTRMASFSPDSDEESTSPKDLAALSQRVSRLETAVTLKLDSMIERMGKIEKRMGAAKKATTASRKSTPKVAKTTTIIPEKVPVKKKTTQPKKTAQPKKASLFHTVKKGETIWSISQKYKTSVAAIRKLNNLSAQDKIYPGNNILVR